MTALSTAPTAPSAVRNSGSWPPPSTRDLVQPAVPPPSQSGRDNEGVHIVSDWIRVATSKSVVRRSLKYGAIVGSVLVTINRGDSILRAELGQGELVRIGLTMLVPYLVSTFSSVGTARELERQHRTRAARSLDSRKR